MRCTLLLVLLAGVYCVTPGWGNGEGIEEKQVDPRTGMVLPVRETPAQVLYQKISIRFGPEDLVEEDDRDFYGWDVRRADIETEYTLYNPLHRPETIHIAFAIPGDVTFSRPPVQFDDTFIDWEYLNAGQVMRYHLPAMYYAFGEALQKKPALRSHLERAYAIYKQHRQENEYNAAQKAEEYLRKHTSEFGKYGNMSAVRVYADYREGKSPRWIEELVNVLTYLKRTDALPWGRWNAEQRFLHPATGAILRLREVEGEWQRVSDVVSEAVSLLRFTITLQPKSTHRLKVRYHQEPAWQLRSEGATTRVQGRHLMYLLRTQSWASYGPIDVEVSVPKNLRVRTSPAVSYATQQGNWRIYQGRITQPKDNLYFVVGEPGIFRQILVHVKNPAGKTVINHRHDIIFARRMGGSAYLPVRYLLEDIRYKYAYNKGTWHTPSQPYTLRQVFGRVELASGEQRLVLRPGSSIAQLNGRTVRLAKPPVVVDGQTWLDIRDYCFLGSHLNPVRDIGISSQYPVRLDTKPTSPFEFKVRWNNRLGIVILQLPGKKSARAT